MQPELASHRRGRMVLAAALIAAGCTGSGSGCGSSCGGAFKKVDELGRPLRFAGQRLDNAAQLRISRSGLDFLDATHLNDLFAQVSGTIRIPCFERDLFNTCGIPFVGNDFHLLVGDNNFNGVCDAADGTPIHITFRSVTWGLDPAGQALRARILAHIKTGDIYVRTKEKHPTLCGSDSPIQAHAYYDDEDPQLTVAGLPKDTQIDLDVQFATAPDGRLELDVSQASLDSVVDRFIVAAVGFNGYAGSEPAPAPAGTYIGDGCDTSSVGTYSPLLSGSTSDLRCSAIFRGCAPGNTSLGCQILDTIRSDLFQAIKGRFAPQIVGLLRSQIDKARCQLSQDVDLEGKPIACDGRVHLCPKDDDGNALDCDTGRGVCLPHVPKPGAARYSCEPAPLAMSGRLDVSELTDKVGFPQGARLDLFAGLGSKAAHAQVDRSGLQLSAMAGTAPASTLVSLCVPPAQPPAGSSPPPLDFDEGSIRPASGYDVGFALSSTMLNRGFYDAYAAGLLCATISNQTTSRISTGIVSTFLPSLRLLTGGKDAPMAILLRPQQPPVVRIGRNSAQPADPLITLAFKALHLDFYAPIDERMVRIFTLQADLSLPLSLRPVGAKGGDVLLPVLGDLQNLITNVRALDNEVLAEDPGVVAQLLPAVVQLAQPLLAGVLKPIQLPKVLSLDVLVRQLVGALPFAEVAAQGYQHLAAYAQIADCGPRGTACATAPAKTEARIASSWLPDDAQEIRGPGQVRPQVEIEASARTARGALAEFSYRIDGGLWSPWLGGSRFTVRDAILLFPGRHRIEVIAREAGDDHTADPEPIPLDFFVSYQAPAVELRQRDDGAVVTFAQSSAARAEALLYSYQLGGGGWTRPGPARVFAPEEIAGRTLQVTVSDEAGRSGQARFAMTPEQALEAGAAGCATSSQGSAWNLLPLLFAALLFVRRNSLRKGPARPGTEPRRA